MSKDEIKIDITNIERLYNEFLSCSNNFSSNALDTLNQSYMSKCSDNRIKGMYSKILNYYKKIEKNYSNILNWWEEYLNDAKGLENYLKGTGSSIVIKNTTLRSFINRNLREIEKYKNPNSNIFPKVNTDLSFDSRKFESLSDVNNAIGKDASNLQNYIDNINTNLDANFKNVSSRNSNPNVNGYNGNIENLFNIQNNGTNNNKNVNVYNGIIGNNSNFQNNYTNSNLNIFYNNLDSSKINNNEINAKAYNGFFGKNNVNVYKGISIDTSLNLDVNALPQNLPLSSFLTLNSDAQKQYLNSGKIFFNDIKANVTMLSQSDFNKLPGTEQKKFKEQGGVIRQELTQSEYDNLDTKDKLIFLAMGGCVAGRGGDTTIREEQLYTMTESEQFTYLALGGKIRGNVLTDNYTPSIEISEMQDILKQINNIKYYFKDGNIIFNINDEEYNMLDIPEPIITYLTISDESLFDTLCDYRNKLIENTETNSNVYTTVNDIIETSKLYANYVTGDKSYKEYLTDKEFATLYKTFMNEGYYDAINYFSITIPTQRIGKIDLNHKVDEDLCSHFSQNANLDYLNNKKQDDYGELSRIRAEIRTSETSDAQLEIIKNLWQTRDNICEQFETNLNEILQLSQLKESGKYSDDIVISNYIDNKIEILKAENDSLKQQLSQAEQKAKQDIYNCVKTDNIPNFKNAKLLDDKIVIDNKKYNYNEIPPLTYAY